MYGFSPSLVCFGLYFLTHLCIPAALQTAYLDVSNNQLSGNILPNTLDNVGNLTRLDLSGNLLTGSIPSSIFALNGLTFLNVAYNMLNGSLPDIEPGSLTSLGRFCVFWLPLLCVGSLKLRAVIFFSHRMCIMLFYTPMWWWDEGQATLIFPETRSTEQFPRALVAYNHLHSFYFRTTSLREVYQSRSSSCPVFHIYWSLVTDSPGHCPSRMAATQI
jgi:hypothetical protein